MKRKAIVVNKQMVISTIFMLIILLPVLGIVYLVLYFTGTMFLMPFVVMLFLSWMIMYVTKSLKNKKHQKIMHYVIGGMLFISVLIAIPGLYHKTRPVVTDTEVDLHVYQPFHPQSKAVKLNEAATLQIEDDLPVIDGATALYPLYAAFVQAVYPEKEYPPYDSEVMSNRTGLAYENLINGAADIIFVAAPSSEQLEFAKSARRQLELTPIGKEAFVFFVHDKNPVESLRTDQLKGIYSGEITNWKEFGGKNSDIRAFQRAENSGSQTALQHFMGSTPIMDPPVEDVASLMGTIIDVVSDYRNYPNAIGFTFRYYATEMVENHDIRLLSINGVEPTVENIKSGEYPLTNEFYAVTAGSTNPHIDDFITWILSEQGQEIVEKTGYVPINEPGTMIDED